LLLDYLRSDGQLTAKDFRYVGCDGRGFDQDPGAGPEPGRPSIPFAFTDVLHSETWRALRSVADFEEPRTMFQPAGGMDRLPYAFARHLGPLIRYEHSVEKVRQSGTKVHIEYSTPSGRGTLAADYCICTIPLSVLRNVDLQVSTPFKLAINSASYDTAGKLGIQMGRRFWEEDHGIYGGHIYFDDQDIHTISLPSTGWLGKKGVVLGYYQFNAHAAKISALTLRERADCAVAAGQKIFPQYADHAESFFSIAWHRVQYSMGGWARWSAENRKSFYPLLCEPDGRLYLAGEHLSYLTGWQEGAIESAWLQLQKLHQRVHA
jgi:monoamine oxidase